MVERSFQCRDCTASDDKMTDELERINLSLGKVLSLNFVWETEKNCENFSASDEPVEIRIEHLPNENL
jgi:hypothetical protein